MPERLKMASSKTRCRRAAFIPSEAFDSSPSPLKPGRAKIKYLIGGDGLGAECWLFWGLGKFSKGGIEGGFFDLAQPAKQGR